VNEDQELTPENLAYSVKRLGGKFEKMSLGARSFLVGLPEFRATVQELERFTRLVGEEDTPDDSP
jgi:hypothetical protein